MLYSLAELQNRGAYSKQTCIMSYKLVQTF